MAHNIVTVCEELAIDYEAQAMNAYGRGLDPFVMTARFGHVRTEPVEAEIPPGISGKMEAQ